MVLNIFIKHLGNFSKEISGKTLGEMDSFLQTLQKSVSGPTLSIFLHQL